MNFLNKPYPYAAYSPSKFWMVLFSGLFVGLFLLLFQPFGLNQLNIEYKSLFLLGYGLVTSAALVFYMYVFPFIAKGFYSEKNWTVGKEILHLLMIVSVIGLGNYFYSGFYFNVANNWLFGIISFQAFTLLIGLFPITAWTLLSYNRYLKINLKEAGLVNASIVEGSKHEHQHFAGKALKLTSTNQGDEPVEVMIDDFLFVRSDGNYLDVYFLEEGKMQHSLIRNTLVNAVSILSEYFPPLIRCHRSYIINLDRIENVDGNAQGLIVKLKNCNEKVPVSRKYIEELKSKLK
jgi:hypothetical protein